MVKQKKEMKQSKEQLQFKKESKVKTIQVASRITPFLVKGRTI